MDFSLYKNYQALRAAVVGNACEEYCYALRNKKKFKPSEGQSSKDKRKYRKAVKEIKDCEEFFKNDIGFYLDNPPEYKVLIKRLKYIAKNKKEFNVIRFLGNISSEEVE